MLYLVELKHSIITVWSLLSCRSNHVNIHEFFAVMHVFQKFPKYGKKVALIDGVTGREYSYNEVQESVVNMASGLVRSGMEKGDVLALVSPNSTKFCTQHIVFLLAMGRLISS